MSRPFRVVVVALCILLLNACGKDPGYTSYTVPKGYLRIVNAIPDSPRLNMYVNDVGRQQINFSESSPFFEVLPQLSLRLSATYFGNQQAVDVFRDSPVYVDIDHDYTAIMAGTLDAPTLIRIDNVAPASTQEDLKTEMQFANAANSTTNPVDIDLLQNGQVMQHVTLGFGEVSDLLHFDAGNYQVKVTDSVTNALLWESTDAALNQHERALAVLEDHFGPGGGVRLFKIGRQVTGRFENDQLPSKMRVANMNPQGAVDVYVNGTLFAQNVGFQQVTDYQDIASAAQDDVVITPTGQPIANAIAENNQVTIPTGEYETVAIAGSNTAGNGLLVFPDDKRPIPVKMSLTATNASLSAGAVDVYLLDSGTALADANPRMSSLSGLPAANSLLVLKADEGSFDLVVTATGTKNIVYGPQHVDLVAGKNYSIYLSDKLGGGTPLEVVYGDDFTP